MNSIFKLSLFAASLAFAVPAMAATAKHSHSAGHHAAHATAGHVHGKKAAGAANTHKNYKGHRHSGKNSQMRSDKTTDDLNARSLQQVNSVNNQGGVAPAQGQQAAPGMGNMMAPPPPVYTTPGTGNTMAAPPPPVYNAPGAVNPNNMPPAQ